MHYDTDQQLWLGLLLAALMLGVALELRVAHFRYVLRRPLPVLAGLLAQCLILPWATWLATLALQLPPGIELGLLLVACCPGGNLSNVITHLARGNTALSVSVTSLSSLGAMLSLPLNFALTSGMNPDTAAFLQGQLSSLQVSNGDLLSGLLLMLVLPLLLGMALGHIAPQFTARILPAFKRFTLLAFVLFLLLAMIGNRQLLLASLSGLLLVVIVHNASALLLGAASAWAFGLPAYDRRALTIEVGMQNSGLALGLIFTQFGGQADMALIAALWGTWHIVSGLLLVLWWRRSAPKQALS
ncbi:bile acid:sodium symporter family protein [Atopomonas sediminilitoris]|uniref:bile acid:sodium symporter family protein n=1 Tax=Atopomonas sediminilitoris TaxID=2919919 RepID=UPI001F4E2D6B|nr:bile acid:sodium symporter [Atopomonas sediminilitoris]MCJ8169870.1 bile acid:sodium symporter [Atopomonas sediminilitoris]